jgi:hypothetical protein
VKRNRSAAEVAYGVIGAILTVVRLLPVFPDQQRFSDLLYMSQTCQSTKSLRSSPLRGSKSREAG